MNTIIGKKAGALALLFLLCLLLMCPAGVLAAGADEGTASETTESLIGVEYRGHVENYGNMPTPDGTFISGPEAIGTRGQGLRVEGFWIALTGDLPEGASICYQVHVENEGWMEPVKDGAFAGTQGQGLRVESIKIWLENMPGYDVYYRGHVQNVGNIPTENDTWSWVKDGQEMGTTGSGLRLEELEVKIVKKGSDLTAYNALLDQIAAFNQADYTTYSWNHLQTTLSENEMTDQNDQEQVDQAVATIQTAVDLLENISNSIVYDEAGVYGPTNGVETVDQDVIIMADGVTLQNMNLTGNLIITEEVGDGDVTLNNITVAGDTRIRGGGIHSIHINGGQYKNIIIQKLATGQLRIVTTDAYDENGMPLVIAEDAVDDIVYIDGQFDNVTIYAPGAQVIMEGDDTSVGTMTVTEEAQGSSITVGTGTEIGNLEIGATSEIKGDGTVKNADVNADGVVFEKRPVQWQEKDDLDVPPVMPDQPEPAPTPGGGGGGGGSVTPSQSGAPKFSMVGPYISGETLTIGPGSLATQTNLTYTWYASDNKTYEAGTDSQISAGENYMVSASDLGKYLIVIATTPDIAGSGMVVSDDVVIAGQLSAVTINTQAPVTGSEIANGSSTIDHATGPVVTWSADGGVNFVSANTGDKFNAPIAYQTKYVYDADENYRFDKDIENTVGTAGSTITVNNLGAGSITAAVTTTSSTNDTLTITVTWPSTIASIDKAVTINTQAPVTGNPIQAGTNTIDHASAPVVKWSSDNGTSFATAGANDKFTGPINYQTQYTYTADENYQFDASISVWDITTTGASGTSAAVTTGSRSNDTLTITLTWPKTFGLLNSLTIDTPAPVNTKAIENGTNSIESGSSMAVSWWKKNIGTSDSFTEITDANEKFVYNTYEYMTKYVYTANSYYQFSGISITDINVTNGGTVKTLAVSSGAAVNDTLTITVTWPAVTPALVSALDLSSLVTAPSAGASPVTTAINESQYFSGQIGWYKIKDNGVDVPEVDQSPMGASDTFEASCVYQAAFGMTTYDGYTFTGLEADSFSYTGADSVTNDAVPDSTAVVTVTITFPEIVAGPTTFTLQKAICNGVSSSSASWGVFSEDDSLSGEEHQPPDGYQIFGIKKSYGYNLPYAVNSSGHIKYWYSDAWTNLDSGNTDETVSDYNTSRTLAGGTDGSTVWTYDTSTYQSYYNGAAYYKQGNDNIYYTNFSTSLYQAAVAGKPLLGSCSVAFAQDSSGSYIAPTYFIFQDAANDQLVLANAESCVSGYELVRIPAPTIPTGYKICGFDSTGEGSAATITVYICNKDQAYQR